jgi:hypothetical protein
MDLARAQERAHDLQKIAEAKEFELRRAAENLDGLRSELAHSKDEGHRLGEESVALQRQLDRQNEEKSNLMRLRDSEAMKNRELTASAYDVEGRLRSVND